MVDKKWWMQNRDVIIEIIKKLEEYRMFSNEDFLDPRKIINLLKGFSGEVSRLYNECSTYEVTIGNLKNEIKSLQDDVEKLKKKPKKEETK